MIQEASRFIGWAVTSAEVRGCAADPGGAAGGGERGSSASHQQKALPLQLWFPSSHTSGKKN